ncbi:NAD(P)H-dependent oxidoreductase [Sphingopyxis sp. JAI128]|uniref:NAD(P)H-dependent oxidoreductase n=1 Tax=Sphingopyxis sp. JAI128 TaxID=2723066 RepID=UPI0016159D5E|nr:NAD(P)H-dependent oxidoreductase [Sphingopyxis sp. JAI128]MBB6424687.1 NAD(P)H-dependent FMN reductase [Sphingopyxis sp. JAI128]
MAALRAADGIIVASPAYHGTVSGVAKNALDYVRDLVSEAQPYFDGRAAGLIVGRVRRDRRTAASTGSSPAAAFRLAPCRSDARTRA